jgi:hypothetical protein
MLDGIITANATMTNILRNFGFSVNIYLIYLIDYICNSID